MNEEVKRWVKASYVSLFIFGVALVYLYSSRGEVSLNIVNKAFGQTAALIAAFTLIIGPAARSVAAFARFTTIRRHLGLVAFAFLLFHVIASLAQTERFPWFSWYLDKWVPVVFGLFATTLWVYMVSISSNDTLLKMGVHRWQRYLHISGYISFVAIFLHIVLLKYSIWLRFYMTILGKATPENAISSPPASLLVSVFMLLVIIYRIILTIRYKY